jgi:hypothetical protein
VFDADGFREAFAEPLSLRSGSYPAGLQRFDDLGDLFVAY